MKKIILSLLFLAGCAGLEKADTKDLGTGAVIGATASKAIEKVQETLSPKYLFLFQPVEICSLEDTKTVTCFLVPCSDSCQVEWERGQWESDNPKVITVQSSLLVNATHFCNKNPDFCLRYISEYSGKTIVVKDKEQWQ